MIDLSRVSACLISKDSIYPPEVLAHVSSFPFGEVLVLTHSDSPHRKHELFAKAKYELLYYNDDDAICPIKELAELAQPEIITQAIKPGHFEAYKDRRMSVGLGWGAIFPKKMLESLKKYTDVYGEDDVYKRETERALTFFNFPQNRIVLPITDLPSAMAPDRLWRQTDHVLNMNLMEQRCQAILDEEDKTNKRRIRDSG